MIQKFFHCSVLQPKGEQVAVYRKFLQCMWCFQRFPRDINRIPGNRDGTFGNGIVTLNLPTAEDAYNLKLLLRKEVACVLMIAWIAIYVHLRTYEGFKCIKVHIQLIAHLPVLHHRQLLTDHADLFPCSIVLICYKSTIQKLCAPKVEGRDTHNIVGERHGKTGQSIA